MSLRRHLCPTESLSPTNISWIPWNFQPLFWFLLDSLPTRQMSCIITNLNSFLKLLSMNHLLELKLVLISRCEISSGVYSKPLHFHSDYCTFGRALCISLNQSNQNLIYDSISWNPAKFFGRYLYWPDTGCIYCSKHYRLLIYSEFYFLTSCDDFVQPVIFICKRESVQRLPDNR